MAKKHGKLGRGDKIADERMHRAKTIYLEKLGEIPDTRLATIIGVHRNTIKKWKDAGDWDALVTRTKHGVDKRITERAADKIAKQAEQAFTEIFTNMRLLSLVMRKKIIVSDDKGRPVLDSSGNPETQNLSASDIRSLVGANETYQRMIRLQSGLSTENTKGDFSGNMDMTHKDDRLSKTVDRILESGDAEAQTALTTMMESLQKLVDAGEEEIKGRGES